MSSKGGPDARSPGIIRPATQDAVRARSRSQWIGDPASWIAILIDPVQTPFPYIPVHVIQTPAVGRITSYRCRPVQVECRGVRHQSDRGVIFILAIEIRHSVTECIAMVERTCRAGPTRILPFRFCRQAVCPANGKTAFL